MKRDRNFFFFITMIIFITCYTTALILSFRTVELANFSICGSILVYPFTYFIAILFSERYGNENTKMMLNYSVLALLFMAIILTFTSLLPYNAPDGLEVIFNLDYRVVFGSIASFYVGQYLCLYLYNYLSGFRGFKFLIAAVISITVDSIIFVALSKFGVIPFTQILKLFTGQYVCNIIMIIIYTIFFTYIVDAVAKKTEMEIEKEEKIETEKPKKKTTTKKRTTKKETK